MVLDDRYGEFDMLSVEIVKMVEDFDDWKFPNLESLSKLFENSDEACYSEAWLSHNMYNMFEEEYFPHLKTHQLESIKKILEFERISNDHHKCHSLVSSFVKWYFQYSNWSTDIESELYDYFHPYKYYIEGKIPYDGFEPNEVEKIEFFKDYNGREYFRQMGPHWLNRFKELIREWEDRLQPN